MTDETKCPNWYTIAAFENIPETDLFQCDRLGPHRTQTAHKHTDPATGAVTLWREKAKKVAAV